MNNVQTHLKYLKKDLKCEIVNISNIYYLNLISFFTTIIFKVKSLIWGVKVGHSIRCIGVIKIRRHQLSKIQIGDKCRFNSMSRHNMIGINRECILSTQTENAKIEIGENCSFSGTVIGAFECIKIGNNVRCGANTLITDSDWHVDDFRISKPKEITIEDNVWLGVNAVVLKGVTIGKNTVIGANSVVTKSIPADVIAAGNPCKIIRNINAIN